MPVRLDPGTANRQRTLERLSVYAGLAAGLAALLWGLLTSASAPASATECQGNASLASAMPAQGWAPLLVHFGAYGSGIGHTDIVRYEWDLDGNGQFDYDATAQSGYASYLYSKPGDYAIALRTTDALGTCATDLVTITVRHPAASSVDYWTVFNDSQVRRIDVSLSQAEWARMWEGPEVKYQARADAIIFGERLNDIGFRMRGQFSLRASNDKKPFEIDTDAFIDGQEYHNLRRLLLTNSVGDPSLLREKLAYEMMRFAGVPASHVAFVQLWIDIADDEAPAVLWGVYSLVERVDNKYLSNRFGRDSLGGNLYKASHAQRGPMDLVYYGESISDYPVQNGQYAYGKMNNEDDADYSDIVALCRAVDGTEYASEADLVRGLEAAVNVDTFLRYLAVITVLDNFDAYPNTGNNYYLFNNPASGRFEWIPWDLTCCENPRAPLFPTFRGEMMPNGSPLVEQTFSVTRYRLRYLAYVDLLLREWFTTAHVTDRVQTYHRLIAPVVQQATGDKAFYGDQPMFPPEAFASAWQYLVSFTSERNLFLRQALEEVTAP
jgi:hypothetical protein